MLNKVKKFGKSRTGFTLVEIIVVLVIIAILAAIAIPSLVGYINDANDKRFETEANSVYVAAQAVASSNYSANKTSPDDISADDVNKLIGDTLVTDTGAADDPKEDKDFEVQFSGNVNEPNKIVKLFYTTGGKTVTYDVAAKTYTVE